MTKADTDFLGCLSLFSLVPYQACYRPQKWNIWLKFHVEFEFEIDHTQFLRPDLKV